MARRPGLSDAERDVLKALWNHGPGTIREMSSLLRHRGKRWAYTTVATLMQRLGAKGYAASDPSAVPHIYRALVTRNELLEDLLEDTAEELCDGRAAPMVLALVQGGHFSAEELARLRRLLDEATNAASSTKPKSAKDLK
jgi:predicted transcriptional regulator